MHQSDLGEVMSADDVSKRQAAVKAFRSFTFGNVPLSLSIELSSWPDISPQISGECEIIIDENNPKKLNELLLYVVAQSPRSVEIYATDEAFRSVLNDHHVSLLKNTECIAIPKSCRITDDCLSALRHCKAICLAACENMTMDTVANLAFENDMFYQVQLWGWGSRRPASLPVSSKFLEAVKLSLIKQ